MEQPAPNSGMQADVRALCGGSPAERAAAAAALHRAAVAGGLEASQAVPAAIAEAGGIDALVQLLQDSQDESVLLHAAVLLAAVESLPGGARAILAAGGAPPLVRCLGARRAALEMAAAGVLANMASSEDGGAAIAPAIPAAIQLLGSSSSDAVVAEWLTRAGCCATTQTRQPAGGGRWSQRAASPLWSAC